MNSMQARGILKLPGLHKHDRPSKTQPAHCQPLSPTRRLPCPALHMIGSQHAVCAGDQFALFESVVALAMLVRRFNFSMAPSAPAVGMTTVRLHS